MKNFCREPPQPIALNPDAKLIVALRDWLGFSDGRWMPREIKFYRPRFAYLRVDPSEAS